MIESFEQSLARVGLQDYYDILKEMSRPSLELHASDGAVDVLCSKIGGDPELPADFEWPTFEEIKWPSGTPTGKVSACRFLFQLNLNDIPRDAELLPKDGFLTAFYAHTACPGAPNYLQVFHFQSGTQLQSRTPSESGLTCPVIPLAPRWSLDVPLPPFDHEPHYKKWPIPEEKSDEYWDMRWAIHSSKRYLFGFPSHSTLCQDPTPGPDWQSLINLTSNDDLDWYWGDGDHFQSFIRTESLKNSEFSDLETCEG